LAAEGVQRAYASATSLRQVDRRFETFAIGVLSGGRTDELLGSAYPESRQAGVFVAHGHASDEILAGEGSGERKWCGCGAGAFNTGCPPGASRLWTTRPWP